jgi:hypothetical protein
VPAQQIEDLLRTSESKSKFSKVGPSAAGEIVNEMLGANGVHMFRYRGPRDDALIQRLVEYFGLGVAPVEFTWQPEKSSFYQDEPVRVQVRAVNRTTRPLAVPHRLLPGTDLLVCLQRRGDAMPEKCLGPVEPFRARYQGGEFTALLPGQAFVRTVALSGYYLLSPDPGRYAATGAVFSRDDGLLSGTDAWFGKSLLPQISFEVLAGKRPPEKAEKPADTK